MKSIVIVFVFCFAISTIAAYLMFSLSPFNEEAISQLVTQEGLETKSELATKLGVLAAEGRVVNYLNSNSLALLVATTAAALGAWVFAGQYLWLTLRRKLYQQIDFLPSLRRSAWFALALVTTIYYRIYNIPFYLLVGTIVLVIAIEYLIVKATLRIDKVSNQLDNYVGK
jgi:flagellar biosynthesis protein FlhB